MACVHGVVGDCERCDHPTFGTASAECPVCGWREHQVDWFEEDDSGCLVATYLTCCSCGTLSAIHHE